jgi:FlaA1/EpsC-like NDP-sugar epimerase
VVPLFRNQIRQGGPVTVTHPEVKRYFITIHEAVQLVLQAAVMGKGGEVFVLDMGEPYKILDLANTMITLSGYTPNRDIPICFVGLRPGEKMVEELFEKGEERKSTSHSKISIAQNGKVTYDIPPYLERLVEIIEHDPPPEKIRLLLKELLPTCTDL